MDFCATLIKLKVLYHGSHRVIQSYEYPYRAPTYHFKILVDQLLYRLLNPSQVASGRLKAAIMVKVCLAANRKSDNRALSPFSKSTVAGLLHHSQKGGTGPSVM